LDSIEDLLTIQLVVRFNGSIIKLHQGTADGRDVRQDLQTQNSLDRKR